MARRGFTLFEMLISAGLMSLLLTIVYASLHRAWILRTIGTAQAEHDRLARFVLRHFERTIARASFPPIESAANAWANASIDRQFKLDRNPGESTIRESRPIPVDCGILGTRDTLVVFHDPSKRDEPQPLKPLMGQLTLLATGGKRAESMPQRVSGKIDWQPLLADETLNATLLWAEAETQREGLAGSLTLTKIRFQDGIDSEAQLRFRYFDGREWHASWDTCQRGDNPRAVEMVLTLRRFEAVRNYRALAIPARSMPEVLP